MVEATLETRTETTEPLPLAEQIQDTRKNVLLVEDNEDYRKDLASILESLNYKVIATGNYMDALRIIKTQRIDYASLDLYINGINNSKIPLDKNLQPYGNILAREIKRRYPKAKIVGLSQEPKDLNGDFDLKLDKWDSPFEEYQRFFTEYQA
ncbi:hypothetical protein B6U80_00440 [Candidatus Pacearchaeota archaeon ex4484_26]|nr:MAG: hypothetical protein B6U80_00440 [Candidatus Pacearchaeota archaeon ex4484_26]